MLSMSLVKKTGCINYKVDNTDCDLKALVLPPEFSKMFKTCSFEFKDQVLNSFIDSRSKYLDSIASVAKDVNVNLIFSQETDSYYVYLLCNYYQRKGITVQNDWRGNE